MIDRLAARAAWEADLVKGLEPDECAEVFDYLASHPDVCDRATLAELQHPNTSAGAVAAMLAFHHHATKPRRSTP
jgi:hypothetical protein